MIERLFPHLCVPMSFDDWRQLPRNSAYRYEYRDQHAHLFPCPRFFHAQLDLQPMDVPAGIDAREPIVLRPLVSADWGQLVVPFMRAFDPVLPFCTLRDAEYRQAVETLLDRTRRGEDGPLIDSACFVAWRANTEQPCGALLVTLIPPDDLTGFGAFTWDGPPPPDAVAQRLGQPHLTWIFVSHAYAGHGIGSALLAAANRALLALGYTHLISTFLAGNDFSTLWHWRNGFRLLPDAASYRLFREQLRARLALPNVTQTDDGHQGEVG